MAKTWYPVVDYLECVECGTCVQFCPHGVYDTSKAPSPLVVQPDNCVDRCHGCGNRCPQGAITYAGDDTGWKPPHGKNIPEEPCCDRGGKTVKKISVRRK
jgi:NAD-dependent dihydropyrimidine dehydrogenase PreA subunit